MNWDEGEDGQRFGTMCSSRTGECSNIVDTTVSSVIHPPSEVLSWISSRLDGEWGLEISETRDRDNVGAKCKLSLLHTARSGEGYGVSFTRGGRTG